MAQSIYGVCVQLQLELELYNLTYSPIEAPRSTGPDSILLYGVCSCLLHLRVPDESQEIERRQIEAVPPINHYMSPK